MIPPADSPPRRQELLHGLLSAATEEASAAMRRWTGGAVALTRDEVRLVPLAEAYDPRDFAAELMTMVVLTLQGEQGGTMILTFDEIGGRQLAATLLGKPVNQGPEWTPLERSALTETGNILGCAYMNALTRLLHAPLVPSPPYFIQDFGASVLEQALIEQAAHSDEVLLCQTGFQRHAQELNWNVFFVPTHGMRLAIDRQLAAGAAAGKGAEPAAACPNRP